MSKKVVNMCLESSSLKTWYLTMQTNKRSCSINYINKKRRRLGEFHHLYQDLRKDSTKFCEYMRMTIATFDYILGNIHDKLLKHWTNFNLNPIDPTERLVITIRYLATGASFRSLRFEFRVGFSTVASIVKETVEVIWQTLQPIHMKMPTADTFRDIAKEFYEMWNFPNCLGAIDGKHIRIKCPPHSGTMFYNYKQFFSVVLQAVADANYKFIVIDVGGYGKQSDGGTFRSSALYKLLESGNLNIPASEALPSTETVMPYVFIGDEAYPLLNNLLKPYSRRQLDADKEYFNSRLSRARRVVECGFGIMNSKWRILWKPIETTPDFADKIVKCICVLHNTIIDKDGFDKQITPLEIPTSIRNPLVNSKDNRSAQQSVNIRDTFKMFVCNNRL